MLFIEIQLKLFCTHSQQDEVPELLKRVKEILRDLPASVSKKHFEIARSFLTFEYHIRSQQYGLAARNYSKLSSMDERICLYSHLVITPMFYISRIIFLQHESHTRELMNCGQKAPFVRTGDTFGVNTTGIALAMHDYYRKEYKSALRRISQLMNSIVLNDVLHLEIDLKITSAFFIYKQSEFATATSIIRKLHRKILNLKNDNYAHVLRICKLLEKQFQTESPLTSIQKDEYLIFRLKNTGKHLVLRHLIQEFDTLFT